MKNRTRMLTLAALLLIAFFRNSNAQEITKLPQGWHMLDKATDGYYGISIERTYAELLKGRKSHPLIVAVIDSGVDTAHVDLKPVLWRNPREILGNGKDDDKNGYTDDGYGWNFLGGKDGRNVNEDSFEAARIFHKNKAKYLDTAGKDTRSWATDPEYQTWLKAKIEIETPNSQVMQLSVLIGLLENANVMLQTLMKQEVFTEKELEAYQPDEEGVVGSRNIVLGLMNDNAHFGSTNVKVIEGFKKMLKKEESKANAATIAPEDVRGDIVKDHYADFNDRYYGNPDVMAGTSFHGTHVSGIIGAKRNNEIGMNGIADNIQIMAIRAVADGDEYDKDIALAIRFAVDNGARVINMSFGKQLSPEKHWVDDAVQYAAKKGVLLVHAAGNAATNIDLVPFYPNPELAASKSRAANFIIVGASGDPAADGLVASFSNYGKDLVDVFAPGVQIYSTIPGGDRYGNAQGTSMAAPVVAGIAALIFQYYPGLNAVQVKELIEQSAIVPESDVIIPGSTSKKVHLSELCRTGGIVNAYEAIKLADQKYGNIKKYKKVPKQWEIKK